MNSKIKTMIACTIVFVILAMAENALSASEQPKVELLWPAGAPDAKGNSDGDRPTLAVYLPKEKITDTAVVICPGGGYGRLAMDHEGHQVARWLNSLGITAFILTYRYRNSGAGYGHPAPLQDAQRAIRTVRSRAKEWSVNPERIGVIGFSAGGHLASSVGTHFDRCYYEPRDAIDQQSCRPDFMILIYPVITMIEPFTHIGSERNLLGDNPNRELIEELSNERHVTVETPPTFLIHTYEDRSVPVENSIYFYLALRKAKVEAEMHLYEKGRHGFGLGQNHGSVSSWPQCCADWMCGRGLLRQK